MAQIQKILVAYDGSTQSKEALDWAVDLSLLTNAQIMVVKVAELNALKEVGSWYGADLSAALAASMQELVKEDQKLLTDAIETCRKKGVVVSAELLHGNVAATILDYSIEKGANLIIAGTKGHGALEELLIGSVTNSLVSLSRIPVLVVKD